MMDPMTGANRGFCFVTYCDTVGATEAVKQVSNLWCRKFCFVVMSVIYYLRFIKVLIYGKTIMVMKKSRGHCGV